MMSHLNIFKTLRYILPFIVLNYVVLLPCYSHVELPKIPERPPLKELARSLKNNSIEMHGQKDGEKKNILRSNERIQLLPYNGITKR